MASSFPGVFAGKFAFGSTQQGGPVYYLTYCKINNGDHTSSFTPGINGASLTPNAHFILYLFPDGFYRVRIETNQPVGALFVAPKLPWLSLNAGGGYLTFSDDPADAASIVIGGNPFGSSWQVKTDQGNQQLYYTILQNPLTPNLLTLNEVDGACSTLAPTLITPSLDTIRSQKKAQNADFNNVILIGQDLSQGIDFTGASFIGAQLSGVNFTGATLDQANLSQTDLRGLNWGLPASAKGINLSGSNASGCQLGNTGAGSNRLNCQNANLAAAVLTQANLANLDLTGAQLGSANLNNVTLDYADLSSAILDGAVANNGSFMHAILTDASAQMGIFIDAVLDYATLTRVRMGASSYLFLLDNSFENELNTSKFPQADLIAAFQKNGISLNANASIEVQIKDERWLIDDPLGPYKLNLIDTGIQVFNGNPSLVPAVLRGASLMGATASTASLAGADLRGVRWFASPAMLQHADLEDAALSGAVLVSTDFTQANLSGVDFSNSVLIQANFTGCIAGPGGNRRAISFENAQLQGADFSKSTFSGAVLTDAVVALDNGVPLLFLPLSDEQYLNNSGIETLKPAFKNAGFDLGSSPSVAKTTIWILDNSKCTDPRSPKQYTVMSGSGFQVFANGKYLFSLPTTAAGLLNKAVAEAPLVSLFATQSNRQYTLAMAAPITKQFPWIITPDKDAVFIKNYIFPAISVLEEGTGLTAYGTAPVLIRGLESFYPDGLGFIATQNLANALSANAIGPCGAPFAWIAQGWVDGEAFYLPMD